MLTYTLVAVAVIGAAIAGAIALDGHQRRTTAAREQADDLEAARLRLVAAGEDPDAVHDCNAHEPFSSVRGLYASRHAAVTASEPLDQRTAVLVVDPTLSAAEVATIVEHVEPGAGSLASFAATASDTREMRTGAEQKHLDEVYDAAHDEDVRRELDRAFAVVAEDSRSAWAAIDAWVERYHGDEHYASCVHCAETLHEQSDEYAQLVDRVDHEHTGEISRELLFASR